MILKYVSEYFETLHRFQKCRKWYSNEDRFLLTFCSHRSNLIVATTSEQHPIHLITFETPLLVSLVDLSLEIFCLLACINREYVNVLFKGIAMLVQTRYTYTYTNKHYTLDELYLSRSELIKKRIVLFCFLWYLSRHARQSSRNQRLTLDFRVKSKFISCRYFSFPLQCHDYKRGSGSRVEFIGKWKILKLLRSSITFFSYHTYPRSVQPLAATKILELMNMSTQISVSELPRIHAVFNFCHFWISKIENFDFAIGFIFKKQFTLHGHWGSSKDKIYLVGDNSALLWR